MKLFLALRRDERGLSAAEFGLIVPGLFGLIIGVTQLATLYWSNADVKNAVAAGARLASVYPVPTDDAIIARINEKVVGLKAQHVVAPAVARGTDASGNQYADISMGYRVPLDFIFFTTPPVTLTERRRVYLQMAAASGGGSSSASSSTSSTSSTTSSTGGDASTSTSTSSGGDTSTSSTTSASSTTSGGTTTTSSTSTGGDDKGKDKDKDHDHGCGKKC